MEFIGLVLFFVVPTIIFGPWIYTRVVEGRRRRDLASLRQEIDELSSDHKRLQQKIKDLEQKLAAGVVVEPTTAAPPSPTAAKPVAPTVTEGKPAPPVPTPPVILTPPVVAPPQVPVVKVPSPVISPAPAVPLSPAAKVTVRPSDLVKPAAPMSVPPVPAKPPESTTPLTAPTLPTSASVRPPASPYLQLPVEPWAKTPKPPAPPSPPAKKFSAAFEEMVGTNWLPKLGVVILFIGLVSWIASQWEQIPPVGRIGLFYVLGGTMLGLGIWLEKKERYIVLGRSLIGGGWAVMFFTTYALHYVPASKIIASMELDLFLMMGVTAVMVWHTLKYNSQAVTGLAFLLGFFSIAQSHESVYSLLAGVILAPGLVVIVQKRRWYELEVFGILATFLNHFYWLFPIIDPMQAQFGHNVSFKEYPASIAVLVTYWVIFRTSYVIRKIENRNQETVSTTAALLSTFLFLGVMKYQSLHRELAFFALLILGAIELSLAQLPLLRKRRTAFLVLSTLGACLVVGAVPFRYADDPTSMSVLWLIFAQAFFFAGIFAEEIVYRRFGFGTALLVSIYEILRQGVPFMENILGGGARKTDPHAGTLFALTAAIFYLDSHWARKRWPLLFAAEFDSSMLSLLSYCGGVAALLAAYMFVPQAWVAVALSAVVVVFTLAASRFDLDEIFHQSHVFALVAVADVILNNANLATWVRPASFSMVAVALYVSSRFIRLTGNTSEVTETLGSLYTWAGSLLVSWLAWCQYRDYRTAMIWVAFALVLGIVGERVTRKDLKWQSLALAVLAFVRAIFVNMETTEKFHDVSLRLISVIFVAGVLYLLAKWSPEEGLTSIYSWGGTVLLTVLTYKECANELWIAPLLMLLALSLCGAARYWKRRWLLWQCHALSLLSFGQVMIVNFHDANKNTRAQLLTVLLVIAAMYAISKLGAIAEIIEEAAIPQAYAWLGSFLVTWLMWYQLPSISVAVAWGMFGVVLFEIGHESTSSSYRLQGYLALGASFVLIFFANLNHPPVPGQLNPRVYTVVPLALLYFYVYWRVHALFGSSGKDGKIKAETVLAYLGTGALAALLRFEIAADWVVVAWAVLVVVLLATAKFSKQNIFLHQALLLLVPIAFRAAMYNFYLTDGLRMTTVSVACGVLLCGLPLAFLLRDKDAHDTKGGLTFLLRRPEQLMFFVPFVLFTVLLAIEMPRSMITLSWGVEGIAVFLLALLVSERSFRLTGLALLMLCVVKVLAWDVWNMDEPRNRYLTLIGTGAILLAVSFLYGKYREKVRELL